MTMTTSDIIATVATFISLIALSFSLINFLSGLVKIGVSIDYFSKCGLLISVSNRSSKSICLTSFVLYQGDKSAKLSSNEKMICFYRALKPIYLTPYEAISIDTRTDIESFDLTQPIILCVETTRKTKFFSLDCSRGDNPVIHKKCYYRKHNTDNR